MKKDKEVPVIEGRTLSDVDLEHRRKHWFWRELFQDSGPLWVTLVIFIFLLLMIYAFQDALGFEPPTPPRFHFAQIVMVDPHMVDLNMALREIERKEAECKGLGGRFEFKFTTTVMQGRTAAMQMIRCRVIQKTRKEA